jgi:hypothetical protein
MCRMTETGFRWRAAIPVPLATATWFVYERAAGEQRYSQQHEPDFGPLYKIRIKANTQPGRRHA